MCEWIDSELLDQAIDNMLERANSALENARARLKANVIDPFQSLIIASTFGIKDENQLDKLQITNSVLGGISSAVGNFHQQILGSIPGWINHDAGYDIECEERRIVAEVKNKHNTMNKGARNDAVDGLRRAVQQKRGKNWKAYLVIIVPKKPKRYQSTIEKNIFEIDGASFYELVTGHSDALHQLFDAVCSRVSTTDELQLHCSALFRESIPE